MTMRVHATDFETSDWGLAPFLVPEATLKEIERGAILRALKSTNWNKQAAAAALGLRRPTLYSKMRRHGIPLRRGESNSLVGLDLALPDEGLDLDATLAQIESRLLVKALERTNGVQTRAAMLLGVSLRQLLYKLQKHGLGRGKQARPEPGP